MHTDSGGGNWSAYEVHAYEEFPQLMPRWGYVAAAFALFLIGFFGFFLNLLVILLMFKDRQLWTPLNMILFNLVCSDFSVSVLGNPFTLISALFHRWVFGHNMCVLYGFFMALLGITSITTLTVLAFERYMMVSRPFSARHLTPRGACLTVLFIWSYSLALTTPPLFGWGNYVSEAANISCSVNWQEQTFNTLTYILFLFAMGQAVPCAVIGFSYYNIVRTMKQNAQRLGRVNRAEAKVTTMVFIMIVSFMVAWTPYSVLALMEQFAEHGMVSPGVGVIPALVAKSSICYDPLIYVGMNTQFRSSIKRMFGIHSKEATSNAEPGLDKTMVSATCRSQCTDSRSKLNVSVTANSKNHRTKNKQVTIMEARSEVIKYQKGDYNVYNSTDPSAENKTSETDRSDSDNEHKRKNIEDLCQYDTRPLVIGGKLAVLRVIDEVDGKTSSDQNKAIYKNRAFEDATGDELEKDARQSSDEEDRTKRLWKMRHSSSMEITRVRLDPNLRKMSIPINSDISMRANRHGSIARSVVSKFVDRGPRHVEHFKTSLFTPDRDDFQEDSL